MLFDQLRFQSDSCFSSLWYDSSWIYDFLPLFCAAQTGSRFQNCGAQAVKKRNDIRKNAEKEGKTKVYCRDVESMQYREETGRKEGKY